MENQPQYGAILKKAKFRDFKYEKLFGTTEQLPYEYSLRPFIKVKDQQLSDFCSAFATSILVDLSEGVETDPLYIFAKIKQIEGNLGWGAEIASGMKAITKYGAIEAVSSPYSLDKQTRDFIADFRNWSEVYDTLAKQHLQKSYFTVRNGFEYFKSALWQNREAKRAIATGTMWQEGWQGAKDGKIDFTGTVLGGHLIAITGWRGDWLEIVNSYGKTLGDDGFYWVHKDIVNKHFKWGAYCAIDMTPEEAKVLVWGTKEKLWNAIVKVLQLLTEKIDQLYLKTQSNL